nr:hypothetical protein [Pseudodesulfovibrio sp.]
MKKVWLLCLVVLFLFTFGCRAKVINTRPLDYDYALLANKINGDCGICISEADITKQVVEGNIDSSYQYTPYKDLRFGLGYALKMSCHSIKYYESTKDAIENGSQVIIVPDIKTKSDNSFPFWPPDKFSLTLDTKVFDATGNLMQRTHSAVSTTAERADWTVSNGYAGSKAMEKAIEDFLQKLDYNSINEQLKYPSSLSSEVGQKTADIPLTETEKITQTLRLYQGTLVFPPPLWVNKVKDLGKSKYWREQNKNLFSLEQIPKPQTFDSWKQIYGVYGFYLPEYNLKRFIDESLNALALGCKTQAKSKIISAEDGKIIMTYFCSDLQDSGVSDGYNTESGFLYMSQVDQSFAKVYMAWRAPIEYMKTDKWPMNEERITEALERLKKIRYFKPE